MAPTSAVLHPPRIVMHQETARVCSRKTASLRVPLIFASYIFCLVGRGLCMTLRFSMTPDELIFTSHLGGTVIGRLRP
jgi:hypothetical protein